MRWFPGSILQAVWPGDEAELHFFFLSLASFPSLVPRPFPPPVFDRILYAKTEGEGLGEKVTCVTSGRFEGTHRVDTRGAVTDRCICNSQTLR